MRTPTPTPKPAAGAASRVPWVVAQTLACIGGGAWVGQSVAPGAGNFVGGGAFLFFASLLLAFAAGRKVGMMFGLALLGLRGAQRLRRGHALDADAGRARDQRDERRIDRIAAAVAALAFGGLATLVAMGLWLLADEASLFGALLRGWGVAALVAGLMPWTLPAIDEVRIGGAPPS